MGGVKEMRVLIVEDSQVVMRVLRHLAAKELNFELSFAENMAQAKALIAEHPQEWLAALVDLNLPDAPYGELVDYTLEQKIPTIVLTGTYNDERREQLINKGVVDYVIKESRYSYRYAVGLVNRLYKNQFIKVLVVDDSPLPLKIMVNMLQAHLFQVVSAENGKQALKQLAEHKDIQLLLTDHYMPVMDGFELVQTLRHQLNNTDLSIIGVSGADNKGLSARFIKNGANDFLQKPFTHEEFYCRINHIMESRELVAELKEAAYKDELTGLANRRMLYLQGERLFSSCRQNNRELAVVMLDIDYFKAVNDEYGHSVGDEVLKSFSQELSDFFEHAFCYRTGGEEFVLLMPNCSHSEAMHELNGFRQHIEHIGCHSEAGLLHYSVSIGLTHLLEERLEHTISKADVALYRAKEAGRNMVIGDDE